jgi:D-glycero-alpha-D-manno-heptose 1-phosphate guanylyltransferase
MITENNESHLEVIVLAGGLGTRLRKEVPDLPKSMAPIGGRPFLEVLLGDLKRKGFKRGILSLGYMADAIITHFGKRFLDMELAYAVEEFPLGTGGAVRLAMGECRRDHVYVLNGDTFLDLEVESMERQWQARRQPMIVGCHVPDTGRFGRLITDQEKVVGFVEKGSSGPGLINAGCYILNRGQLDAYPLYTPFSLESDYLSKVVKASPFDLFVTSNPIIDIGVPEEYARAQKELVSFFDDLP